MIKHNLFASVLLLNSIQTFICQTVKNNVRHCK